MKRKFIITAVSDKNKHWCVSGIDLDDSKHYRLVSSDRSIEGAIHKHYLFYEKIKPVKPLDIIEFSVIKHEPQYFQPENLVIDEHVPPKLIGKSSYFGLSKYLTNYKVLLHSNDRKINVLDWNKNLKIDRSLELIQVINLQIVHSHFNGVSKLQGEFDYNGIKYRKISITDPVVKLSLSKKDYGIYSFGECILLVSLGEIFSKDLCRYKLIACIHKNPS